MFEKGFETNPNRNLINLRDRFLILYLGTEVKYNKAGPFFKINFITLIKIFYENSFS